jgi:hypothetical protein
LDIFKPVLNLGIRHIPTPKDTKTSEILSELDNFISKIAWKEYFHSRRFQTSDDYDPYFRIPAKKFSFSQPCQHKIVKQHLLEIIQNNDLLNPPKNHRNPVSLLVSYLKEHPDIRLVLSDKNLGIVAINTMDYHNLVLNHLHSDKYKQIGPNHSLFFQPFRNNILKEFKNVIKLIQQTETNTAILKYVNFFQSFHDWSIPNFHVLIKLHKGIHSLQSRPIVSAVNWMTTPISKILSKKIFPLLRDQHHIAVNTQDIIFSISEFNITLQNSNQGDKMYLVTLDIRDLYTNIDLTKLEYLLNSTDRYLTKLMNFVCHNNYLQYFDKVYQQTNGIAIFIF